MNYYFVLDFAKVFICILLYSDELLSFIAGTNQSHINDQLRSHHHHQHYHPHYNHRQSSQPSYLEHHHQRQLYEKRINAHILPSRSRSTEDAFTQIIPNHNPHPGFIHVSLIQLPKQALAKLS